MSKTTIKPLLRWAISRDLDQIVAIEQRVFDDPWDIAHFQCIFAQKNCAGRVVEMRDAVMGYMVYELCQNGDVRICTLAIDDKMQRRGLASLLIGDLQRKYAEQNLVVEIHERWVVSQLFFRANGFTSVNFLRDVFDDGDGAIVMKWEKS